MTSATASLEASEADEAVAEAAGDDHRANQFCFCLPRYAIPAGKWHLPETNEKDTEEASCSEKRTASGDEKSAVSETKKAKGWRLLKELVITRMDKKKRSVNRQRVRTREVGVQHAPLMYTRQLPGKLLELSKLQEMLRWLRSEASCPAQRLQLCLMPLGLADAQHGPGGDLALLQGPAEVGEAAARHLHGLDAAALVFGRRFLFRHAQHRLEAVCGLEAVLKSLTGGGPNGKQQLGLFLQRFFQTLG